MSGGWPHFRSELEFDSELGSEFERRVPGVRPSRPALLGREGERGDLVPVSTICPPLLFLDRLFLILLSYLTFPGSKHGLSFLPNLPGSFAV
jgi:hypothetical protein